MNISQITAKTILRKQKKIDSWFGTSYGMNLYRGCSHNCLYCDGRDEKYRVEGDFSKDITLKINASEILEKEILKLKSRDKKLSGFIMLGGGVNDSYQPAEKEFRLTRSALELIERHNLPVHLLTKSTLIKRDYDLLKSINSNSKVIASFSFSTIDKKISDVYEPGSPPPSERLKIIEELKLRGISCGMYLMPVIPFVSDTPEKIYDSVRAAKNFGADFIVFGGMTLKPGRQKEYFYSNVAEHSPELLINYDIIYGDEKWGNASGDYYRHINSIFLEIAENFKIPIRIPPNLFNPVVNDNDRVIIILEHLDYLQRMKGSKSPYGYAAFEISKIKEPLMDLRDSLGNIKGVGKTTERIIKDILFSGSSVYYEKMLFYR